MKETCEGDNRGTSWQSWDMPHGPSTNDIFLLLSFWIQILTQFFYSIVSQELCGLGVCVYMHACDVGGESRASCMLEKPSLQIRKLTQKGEVAFRWQCDSSVTLLATKSLQWPFPYDTSLLLHFLCRGPDFMEMSSRRKSKSINGLPIWCNKKLKLPTSN